MRKIAMTILAFLFLAGCAGMQSLLPAQLTVQKVVEAPGMSKDEIFRKSQIWFTKTLRLSKAVTSYERKYRSPLEYVNNAKAIGKPSQQYLYGFTTLTGFPLINA